MTGEREDWNDYRVFAVVARTGSFGGASRQLRISRPRVSQRITHLEERLGSKLMHRLPQGIDLTQEGARVLSRVEAAEAQFAQAASVGRSVRDTAEGECRLALGDGMGTYWFPRFAGAFARAHPRIALRTQTSTKRMLEKAPSHDILIQYSDTPDESLVAIRVATLHFMLFASRGYLAECGTPASTEDLARHRLVDFTAPDSEEGVFASMRGFADRTVLIANAIATQCEAIRWSTGAGLLPTYAGFVHDNLVPIVPDFGFSLPVHLCYEREAAKRPPVRATLNFLKEVVFDPANMPWFADKFMAPKDDWPALMNACMERPLARCPAEALLPE